MIELKLMNIELESYTKPLIESNIKKLIAWVGESLTIKTNVIDELHNELLKTTQDNYITFYT